MARSSVTEPAVEAAAVAVLAARYVGAGLALGLDVHDLRALACLLRTAREPLAIPPREDDLLRIIAGYFSSSIDVPGGLELLPDARAQAEAHIASSESVRSHVGRVIELIEGFEDPYGLELLVTTQRVMAMDPLAVTDRGRAVEAVWSGSPRKAKLLRREHVDAAWERLSTKAWVPSPPRRSGDPSSLPA